MSQQEQDNSQVISDAAVAKATGNLSDEDLERVNGGLTIKMTDVIVTSGCVVKKPGMPA